MIKPLQKTKIARKNKSKNKRKKNVKEKGNTLVKKIEEIKKNTDYILFSAVFHLSKTCSFEIIVQF